MPRTSIGRGPMAVFLFRETTRGARSIPFSPTVLDCNVSGLQVPRRG